MNTANKTAHADRNKKPKKVWFFYKEASFSLPVSTEREGGLLLSPLLKNTVLPVVHAHINPEKAAAPAAPPLVWRWGTQALWQMIHGLWPPERACWLVVVLAVTQGGRDEVLAHSHSSREGLQSHAVHSCLWLFSSISAEPITVWDSVRAALACTFSSGLCWVCSHTEDQGCSKGLWDPCARRAPLSQFPSHLLSQNVFIITCTYLMINIRNIELKMIWAASTLV